LKNRVALSNKTKHFTGIRDILELAKKGVLNTDELLIAPSEDEYSAAWQFAA
jgi:hypothetical protein